MEKGTDKKDDLELWKDPISPEEKIHHEVLFFSQGPVDGYLSGDRARDIFLHSRLPLTVLSQIWNIADVSNDNVLSLEEFVLAMHLILKVKDGLPVPRRLPKHLVPAPEAQANIEDMSDIEREGYQNVFTKLNLESIDAIQGRQLLLESKLSLEELSKVWDLSDIDRNGQLDKEEWMVSCHLIRHMKKGVKLSGPVDVFKWIPQRLSSVSYQARKHRVDEYNRKKHHLMTQKEKRKTQIDNETRRLELLKKRYNLHKELFEVSKTSAELNIPEEEFLLYQEKEENNIEKVEAIVYRLKKEHEKIRQETVKVILGEQGSLQEDARVNKLEQDEVKQRLLTTHTKATKDPDPFHELYELRKELRKRSTLSEGEEPEVHFPFVSSPFDKDSIYPKYSGNTIFVQPSPSVLNNNNSNHKKGEVLRDLCEFGKGFIEKWTSGKGLAVLDSSHDSVFMSLNVPMDARAWSGIRWGDSMDASNVQSLHIRLVDLKEEMEKLNEDTEGQLLFRNPDDYLARKKAQEEEEKLEKSKYQRRGQSDKRRGEKDFKRRSYVAPQRDEESQQALSEYRQKRRSLNLDKNIDKASDPDIPKRTNRRSNLDKKNKENKLTVNTKQPETFSPVSASSPRPVEAAASTSKESTSLKSPNTAQSSTSPTRPSTKRKAAPPPPCSPRKTEPVKQDEIDSSAKPTTSVVEPTEEPKIPYQQTSPVVEPTVESKIPKFVGVTENTQPNRPPRRKKREGNKSFLHDSFERQNSTENIKEDKQLNNAVNGLNQDIIAVTKSKTVESVPNKPRDNLNSEKEDSLLESVIKEVPSLKSSSHVDDAIVKTVVKTELETVPVQNNKEDVIIAKTNDGLELEIKPERVSREKGKFKLEETQTQIELKVRDTVVPKTVYIDSDNEQEVETISNDRNVEIDGDEPDGYLDHIKPVAFKKQATVEDLDQAFEKIALLSYSKKSKDTRDTVSIASDISSAGSEPPPLPDSAPPSFPELLSKTPSLTEISETMEVTETREVEQAPPFVVTSGEAMNGELSPVMSPISDLKSISMRVTSPTRDRGGDVTTNGGLTIDVGENKHTLDYDSDMSDEGQSEVVGTFTPGELETKNIPTETQADDGGIQLLSYSAKLHSPNSDQSGLDSAFEDMQSSMTSNDPLSSTFEDIVQEDYVVSEKANKAETSPKIKEENVPEKVAQKLNKPQRSEFKTIPGTKDFVAKAQQFAEVVQKPPNMRVKLKREISGPQDLTDAAYLKLEAERQAVISSSTMKKKGIDLKAQYNVTEKVFDPKKNADIATRLQFPVKPAYALTIHKAQGMTLPWVEVDCRDIFKTGQLGVAMSRARSSEGLRVINFHPRYIIHPPAAVHEFMNLRNEDILEDMSCCRLKCSEPDQPYPPAHVEISDIPVDPSSYEMELEDDFNDVIASIDSDEQEALQFDIPVNFDIKALLGEISFKEEFSMCRSKANIIISQLDPENHRIVSFIKKLFLKMSTLIRSLNMDVHTGVPESTLAKFFQQLYEYTNSIEYIMNCLVLFDIGTEHVFETEHKIVCYRIVEHIRQFMLEQQVQLLQPGERRVTKRFVTDASRSRIRYVAGYCVAKLRKKYTQIKQSKIFSHSKEAHIAFKDAGVTLNIINLFKEEEHYLQQVTSDRDSLIDTERRQNVRRGLTNVTDGMFEFFLRLTDICLAKLVNENLIKYGKSMFNNCLEVLQSEKKLYEHFAHMVVIKMQAEVTEELISSQEEMQLSQFVVTMAHTSAQICSIYNEMVQMFFMVLFAQFCKDVKGCFHIDKTMAHRKQIKISKTTDKSKIKSSTKDKGKSKTQVEQQLLETTDILRTPQAQAEPEPGTSSMSSDQCKKCQKAEGYQWIQCDSCDAWLHRKCAGLQTAKQWKKYNKEGTVWSCQGCKF